MHLLPNVGLHCVFQYTGHVCTWVLPSTMTTYATWARQNDAHPVDTPMVAGLQLRRPDKSTLTPPEIAEWAAWTPYHELVGSLNYIAIATHLDISYAVSRLASFLDCFQQEHWMAVIHMLRYLKGTWTLLLVLGRPCPSSLIGYTDADFANCKDTSRSISGYCYTLGSGVVSW